jgi:hypothetical protein
MARGRIGSEAKNGIKIAVLGKQGSRKSNFVADFAKMKREDGKPFRVLYLDCETGSIDGFALDRLTEQGIDTSNIYIIYSNVYKEIEEFCQRAIKNAPFYEFVEEVNDMTGETEWNEAFGEEDKMILDADGEPFKADAIVIDGITVVADEIQDSAINLSEKRASVRADKDGKTSEEKEVLIGTAGLEFKDHTKIKSKGKSLIRNLINKTDKCIGITLRAKDEKVMQKSSKGDMQLTATGNEVPESWGFILYEVYTVVHMFKDKEGEVFAQIEDKDRTGLFKPNEILEETSVSLWQPVIEKNKNRSANVSMKSEDYSTTMGKNEESYKQMVGMEDEPSKTSTISQSKDKELTVSDYIKLLNEAKAALPLARQKAIKPKLEKEGLPIQWNEQTPLKDLKKVYEILKA